MSKTSQKMQDAPRIKEVQLLLRFSDKSTLAVLFAPIRFDYSMKNDFEEGSITGCRQTFPVLLGREIKFEGYVPAHALFKAAQCTPLQTWIGGLMANAKSQLRKFLGEGNKKHNKNKKHAR